MEAVTRYLGTRLLSLLPMCCKPFAQILHLLARENYAPLEQAQNTCEMLFAGKEYAIFCGIIQCEPQLYACSSLLIILGLQAMTPRVPT